VLLYRKTLVEVSYLICNGLVHGIISLFQFSYRSGLALFKVSRSVSLQSSYECEYLRRTMLIHTASTIIVSLVDVLSTVL